MLSQNNTRSQSSKLRPAGLSVCVYLGCTWLARAHTLAAQEPAEAGKSIDILQMGDNVGMCNNLAVQQRTCRAATKVAVHGSATVVLPRWVLEVGSTSAMFSFVVADAASRHVARLAAAQEHKLGSSLD